MIVTKIPAVNRPKVHYRFKVKGSGHFPMDMLRYDYAYPATEKDAAIISGDGVRTIELGSYLPPTPERWASFLWHIQEDDPR